MPKEFMLVCVAIMEINSNCDVAHSHDFSRTKAIFVTVIISIVDRVPLTVSAGCRENIRSRTRDRNTTDVLFLACMELNYEILCMAIRIWILHHLRWKLHAMWLVSAKMAGC